MSGWVHIDSKTALQECDLSGLAVVLLTVPPGQQYEYCKHLAERLEPGQAVVLSPGKLASLSLQQEFGDDIHFAETSAPLLKAEHRPVWLSAQNREQTARLLDFLKPRFPNLLAAESPQECALNDVGPVLYPASLLFNSSRIEKMGPYRTSSCDITPGVARAVRALDLERLEIARVLGWKAFPLPYLLGSGESDYCRAIGKCQEFQRHMSPDSVCHAYISEEVPYGLAPLLQLAHELNIPTPHLQAVYTLARALTDTSLEPARSYSGQNPPQTPPTVEVRAEDFGFLGLQETVVELESTTRTVSLSTQPASPPPKIELAADTDISRSFQMLREALERKTSEES